MPFGAYIMKIFEKNNWLIGSKSAVFKLQRTMILKNINSEFYHESKPKPEQIVSATLDTEKNEITVTVNLDRLKCKDNQ